MEKFKKVLFYINRYKKIIIPLIIIIILSILFLLYYLNSKKNDENIISDSFDSIIKEEIEEVKEEVKEVYYTVDIKGEVISPGVYTLKEGSRVIDVIYMAGGYTEHANTRYINLSKKISDEMTIIIYSNYEIESFKENEKIIIKECNCEEIVNDSCLDSNLSKDENISEENKEDKKELIDINKASLEELMTLNGIGEAKAQLIIEYRESKRFESIEEIKEVSGISDSVYEKIKDFIKVS